MPDDGQRVARRVSSCMEYWTCADYVWTPAGTVTFVYDPADNPCAVRLVFTDTTTWWEFARDLLADGLTGHAGLGDVRVWPALGPRGSVVLMRLSAPEGWALLEFPAAKVRRFVLRAYRQVPRGAEADLIDVDGLVARLLPETP